MEFNQILAGVCRAGGGRLDPYYSANKCKHATSIDHAAGGRWQPHKLWLLIIFGMSENNQKRLLTMC